MPYSPAGLWTPAKTLEVATNINRAYLNAPESAHTYGQQFYPEWKETATHLAKHMGRSPATAAGMIASLSPSNEAELNRIQSVGLVHGGVMEKASEIRHIHAAGQHESMARSAKSTAEAAGRAGDTARQSHFMEQHAQHQAQVETHRRLAGLQDRSGQALHPLAWQSSSVLSKAVHFREGTGGTAADPLGALKTASGEALKLSDFGHMIHEPETYTRPPIDKHFHDAAVNRTDIPYTGPKGELGLSAKSRYEGFQGAHTAAHAMAARALGTEPTHSAMMATVWYGQQMRRATENPSSLRTRRSAVTKLENIKRNDRFRAWMPESHGLAPAYSKISV